MVARFGTLLAPIIFHVNCSFGSPDEARKSVAFQAIYPGRLEEKLYDRRDDFYFLSWSQKKFAYMEDQEGSLGRECELHGLDYPTFNVTPWATENGGLACECPAELRVSDCILTGPSCRQMQRYLESRRQRNHLHRGSFM